MDDMKYTYFRIDGKTPVKRRVKLVEDFNGNPEIFAMVLTTRVGGVGLNIIGADRVVIFDPDWNPMTDVQARERAWRIGQKREVSVYRLVLTGTLEEKIYQRQVYKHFIAQKVLTDPRQRQFFKWSDLQDLFERPPPPPGFDEAEIRAMRMKYRDVFKKVDPHEEEEGRNETTDLMRAISDLPTIDANASGKKMADEHSTILQTLYDASGIKTTFNHDKVEQPLLDRKIVRDGANTIARRAVLALRKSVRDDKQAVQQAVHHHSGSPRGPRVLALPKHEQSRVKREREQSVVKPEPNVSSLLRSGGGGAASADILAGLRQLAQIRSMQQPITQAASAARLGIQAVQARSGQHGHGMKSEPDATDEEGTAPEFVEELMDSDRKVAKMILTAFLNPKLAGYDHKLSTDDVLRYLSKNIAPHHQDLFKNSLKEMCEFSSSIRRGQPGTWTLRYDFWPG